MSKPARGIVFAHGDMARGMVDALRRISGADEDAVVALSNEGLAPDALTAAVEELAGDAPAVVFTDLQAGSCAMAARLACRGQAGRVVVCGVNLAMLLDFVFHREMPLHELADRLVQKGRQAVLCVPSSGGTAGDGAA
ncbi:MAG: hypothetical protein PVI57_18000 [Gemmatimonadota bacterium]|jgi:mannose/fructose-specific phosphotransferase system component IIA